MNDACLLIKIIDKASAKEVNKIFNIELSFILIKVLEFAKIPNKNVHNEKINTNRQQFSLKLKLKLLNTNNLLNK